MGAEVIAGQTQDWRQQTVIDTVTIDALVAAGGPEVFDQLKAQFAADLRSLTAACHDAGCAGNQALVREKAHALRGAALNIGLLRLSLFLTAHCRRYSRLASPETGLFCEIRSEKTFIQLGFTKETS